MPVLLFQNQQNRLHCWDIYKAVEGEKPLLHLDTHTNPDCGVGINIQLSLQEFYNEIQKTAEEKMKYDYFTGYHRYLLSANINPQYLPG